MSGYGYGCGCGSVTGYGYGCGCGSVRGFRHLCVWTKNTSNESMESVYGLVASVFAEGEAKTRRFTGWMGFETGVCVCVCVCLVRVQFSHVKA